MKKILLLFAMNILVLPVFGQQGNLYMEQIKKAKSLVKAKDYKNAAITYDEALKLNTQADPTEQYNAACAWSLAGNADAAFKYLKLITGKTYFNYDHLISDEDLKILQTDKRWNPLLDQIRKAKLQVISADKLYQDYDLLVKSFKEAHTGLYWYSTVPQFDSICTSQRGKIKPGMTSIDFYNVLAPLTAFTKEAHVNLRLGQESQAYMRFSGKYFPLYIKILDKKVYVINDLGNRKTKGMLLSKINCLNIGQMMEKFLSYEPADGFNTTSKYRWIEENGSFNSYYSKAYPQQQFFEVELRDPVTKETQLIKQLPAISFDEFKTGYRTAMNAIPAAVVKVPASLKIDTATATGILSFNTFANRRYKDAKMNFKDFVKTSFQKIKEQKVKHLIIDIRQNGGGSEGFEDYVLSFLIDKDYKKYDYVQASAFTYSFYPYSDYKEDWMELDSIMKTEHEQGKDGRLLRKKGILDHEKPQTNPYKGSIHVLTSGLTYSGGAEFSTLLKEYTKAVFIGEEVGGGYYGNTSGIRITLKLPYSKLEIAIPLLKFSMTTTDSKVPFGHGLSPDYELQPTISQYFEGKDVEMEFAQQLIRKR